LAAAGDLSDASSSVCAGGASLAEWFDAVVESSESESLAFCRRTAVLALGAAALTFLLFAGFDALSAEDAELALVVWLEEDPAVVDCELSAEVVDAADADVEAELLAESRASSNLDGPVLLLLADGGGLALEG
jgi:hypothetical protein